MVASIAEGAAGRIGRVEINRQVSRVPVERPFEQIDVRHLAKRLGEVRQPVHINRPVADPLCPPAFILAPSRVRSQVAPQNVIQPLVGLRNVAQKRQAGIAQERQRAARMIVVRVRKEVLLLHLLEDLVAPFRDRLQDLGALRRGELIAHPVPGESHALQHRHGGLVVSHAAAACFIAMAGDAARIPTGQRQHPPARAFQVLGFALIWYIRAQRARCALPTFPGVKVRTIPGRNDRRPSALRLRIGLLQQSGIGSLANGSQ